MKKTIDKAIRQVIKLGKDKYLIQTDRGGMEGHLPPDNPNGYLRHVRLQHALEAVFGEECMNNAPPFVAHQIRLYEGQTGRINDLAYRCALDIRAYLSLLK